MKTRVLKYGSYYYPQYKGWHFFYRYDDIVSFKNKEVAINYLMNADGEKFKEVVWKSK